MSDFAKTLTELRRPFTSAALKWKIQVNPKGPQGKAMLVCYIDARLAAERLNHSAADWSDDYQPVPGGMMCALTVNGVTRRDVGWSKGTGTDIDLKALYSDAFKRAAVKFGVGVSIYALPKAYLAAAKLTERNGNWYVPDAAMGDLRTAYERWLSTPNGKAFGEPLDHGDSENAQGDVEADPVAA